MSVQVDRQTQVDLFSVGNGYQFTHQGKIHHLSTVEKVHEFFQNSYDTVKICQNGKKSYRHFVDGEVQIFGSKMALRKSLSQESGGRWIEKKSDRKDYMVDNSGVLCTSFKKVSREECLQKLETSSTLQKVLGMGLGILALTPGLSEVARRIPIGAKEAAIGLMAMNQKNPALGALSCSLMSSHADAQAVEAEFQVNTYTTNEQSYPKVTALNDGGFVITWVSNLQDGSSWGVYGQRYDRQGYPAGSEFQANTYTTNRQVLPAITTLNNGDFVILWSSDGQDGEDFGVYGQRYNVSGSKIGSEYRINTETADDQYSPSITSLNDRGYVIVWQSESQDGAPDDKGVYGQRFDLSGNSIGGEFLVNTYTEGDQELPNTVALDNRGFVITWTSFFQGSGSIYGQRYDSNGQKDGLEFHINSTTTSQRDSIGSSLSEGGFMVTWLGLVDGRNKIFGQIFASNGTVMDREFLISNYTESVHTIDELSNENIIVCWRENGIMGTRLSRNGTAVGPDFQIVAFDGYYKNNPSVAGLNNGKFVVVWESEAQDGDGSDIFGKLFDEAGNAIELPATPVSTYTTSATLPSSQTASSTQSPTPYPNSSSIQYSTPSQPSTEESSIGPFLDSDSSRTIETAGVKLLGNIVPFILS